MREYRTRWCMLLIACALAALSCNSKLAGEERAEAVGIGTDIKERLRINYLANGQRLDPKWQVSDLYPETVDVPRGAFWSATDFKLKVLGDDSVRIVLMSDPHQQKFGITVTSVSRDEFKIEYEP